MATSPPKLPSRHGTSAGAWPRPCRMCEGRASAAGSAACLPVQPNPAASHLARPVARALAAPVNLLLLLQLLLLVALVAVLALLVAQGGRGALVHVAGAEAGRGVRVGAGPAPPPLGARPATGARAAVAVRVQACRGWRRGRGGGGVRAVSLFTCVYHRFTLPPRPRIVLGRPGTETHSIRGDDLKNLRRHLSRQLAARGRQRAVRVSAARRTEPESIASRDLI